MADKILLGLTGSFGSGCSTLAEVLQQSFNFRNIALSEEVKRVAQEDGLDVNNREDLQDVGNSLREKHGTNHLAFVALQKVKGDDTQSIVFHGIRNIGEVNELRRHPNFYLVAVDCSKDNRWRRLEERYNKDRALFDKHDARDKNEGLPHGQQVLKCVEEADILFLNNENHITPIKIQEDLGDRFKSHLGLITGDKPRNPSIAETMMTVASTLALQSHCLKRRVGAVLCDKSGYIVSAAYNEVPSTQKKCSDAYGMCYREVVRQRFKKNLFSKFTYCPSCSQDLELSNQAFSCSHCDQDLTELLPAFKALDKCRSLHAEETTILKAAHYQINGSTLYSTTFPCLQCAKRTLQSGIKQVVYIDPYPEDESIIMLETGEVRTKKFEGVKAQAYYKLFYPHQQFLEREINKKLSGV